MAHQIHLDLDDESAARLAALAARAHAQQDDLAVTLLSEALAELERDPADVVAALDRVPGAWKRMQFGRKQAGSGETVGLDEL
jgi:plasmid stability protein